MDMIPKPLSSEQQEEVRKGLASGLKRRQVRMYADPAYTPAQMEQIRLGLLDGLTPSEVTVFADPRVTAEEMHQIRGIYRKAAKIEKMMQVLDDQVLDAKKHRASFMKKMCRHKNKADR